MGETKQQNAVFVLGNGPSVQITDLNRLQNQYVIAANKFYLSYTAHHLRPNATFCVDPMMIKNDIRNILKISHGKVYIPRVYAPHVLLRAGFWALRASFFEYDNQHDNPKFGYGREGFGGNSASVIFNAIQFAARLAPKYIFVYGIDHEFNYAEQNQNGLVTQCFEHNHFIRDYRTLGEEWYPPLLGVIENGFKVALSACEKKGINLFNISNKSKLFTLPQTSLSDALELAEIP